MRLQTQLATADMFLRISPMFRSTNLFTPAVVNSRPVARRLEIIAQGRRGLSELLNMKNKG
jgi:hypothetical protein